MRSRVRTVLILSAHVRAAGVLPSKRRHGGCVGGNTPRASGPAGPRHRPDRRDVRAPRAALAVSAGANRPNTLRHGLPRHRHRLCRQFSAAGARRRGHPAVPARAEGAAQRHGRLRDDHPRTAARPRHRPPAVRRVRRHDRQHWSVAGDPAALGPGQGRRPVGRGRRRRRVGAVFHAGPPSGTYRPLGPASGAGPAGQAGPGGGKVRGIVRPGPGGHAPAGAAAGGAGVVVSDLAVDCCRYLADIPGVSYYVSVCGIVPGDDAAGGRGRGADAGRDRRVSRGLPDCRPDVLRRAGRPRDRRRDRAARGVVRAGDDPRHRLHGAGGPDPRGRAFDGG